METGMVAVAKSWERNDTLNDASVAATETVNLVKGNYEKGLIDFQRVLDAERTLFSTEDDTAISKGQVGRDYVTLYKALGGGSEVEVLPIPPGKKPDPAKEEPAP